MHKAKEEENSRFRSTNTAPCAEKGEFSSSFAMIKMYFSQTKAHSATNPLCFFVCCARQFISKWFSGTRGFDEIEEIFYKIKCWFVAPRMCCDHEFWVEKNLSNFFYSL